jgi:hypothetical protein
MRIQMREWNGVKIAAEYVTTMVRDCITQVTTQSAATATDEGNEPLAYALTGDTLVLAVNDGEYPQVYVCKIVRYGCPAGDEIEIID